MVIVDELPFKFVEGKGFKKSVDRLTCASQPRFVVPSWFTVARDVLKLYVNEKKHLKDMFVNNKYRVSLTTDCWTSGQNINYMVLPIEKNLKDWGIERVLTLTVDNKSSNDTVIAYLLKRFNKGLLLGGEFLHVHCCARILNLIVCNAFKEHNDCIERIRYAVRWNSTYLMLEAAVKFEKAFDRLEDEDFYNIYDLSPNTEDWTNAKMLIRFLKVFYDVTLKISGSLYTTSNMVFHQITVVQNCIHLNVGNANEILVGMANSMKAKFEKYWGTMKKVVKSIGNVVEQCCRRLFHEYSITHTQSGNGRGSKSTCTTTNTPIISASKTMIDCDPTEKNEGDFDILQWWKRSSHRFEVLSRMARDILAITVSTVASESAFSIEGRVVDSSRCSLAPKTVEAFICTQNWLNSGPIDLEVYYDMEEASLFKEGFRAIMDNEKDIQDLPDVAKLSVID
ncbi:zinc finger BED domain-containing protein RICESLEEPER 4-like [Benincasa hispida]|uniref:zinc finger BED domain-containing protein RICESLEEPER 4-like n=1 Tax=Benincasa hispida TaxID=102211 RepID=UPI0019022216|nr:zinc finger BED domain-containing protein RICESLEEPER 4-like [Benincasa hispida]